MRIGAVMTAILATLVGAAVVAARGQSTPRPGDPTQARVFVDNRAPNEAVPVLVQSIATPVVVQSGSTPLTAHLDAASLVQTVAARQTWQYRTMTLQAAAAGESLNPVGMDGWEAVAVPQSSPSGSTILFKRPR